MKKGRREERRKKVCVFWGSDAPVGLVGESEKREEGDASAEREILKFGWTRTL